MNKRKLNSTASILNNSFWNFLSTSIKMIIGVISSILVGRYLGPELFGTYSYINYMTGITVVFATLGFPLMLMKYVSEYSGKDNPQIIRGIFKFVLKIEIAASIAAFSIMTLFVLKVIKFSCPMLFITGALTIFPLAFGMLYGSAIRGIQEYHLNTKIEFFSSIFQILGIFSVVIFKFSVFGFLIVVFFTNIIASTLRMIVWNRRMQNVAVVDIDKTLRKKILKYSGIMVLTGIVNSVVWERSEIFFLQIFSNMSQVAFYSVAYGLVEKISEMATCLASVLLPAASAMWAGGEIHQVRRVYKLAIKYFTFIAVPICFGIAALAKPTIFLLYGDKFKDTAAILYILSIFRFFVIIAAPLAAIIYGLNGHMYLLWLGIGCSIGNIVLDLLLIPKFGAVGAAFANSSTQIFTVIAGFTWVYLKHNLTFPFKSIFKVLIAALPILFVPFCVHMFLKVHVISLVAIILTSVIVFFLIIKVLRFFDHEDISNFIKLKEKMPGISRKIFGFCIKIVN